MKKKIISMFTFRNTLLLFVGLLRQYSYAFALNQAPTEKSKKNLREIGAISL
jgi:hypothetical protein